MSIMTRRTVLKAGAASGLALGLGMQVMRAQAAEFTYKIAAQVPNTHPAIIFLTEAAKKIAEETGGRLQIEIYASGTLGGEREVVSQVRSGAIEMMITGGPAMAPNAAITAVGFAFPDTTKLWPALDSGALGQFVRSEIEANGLHPFQTAWNLGFYHVAGRKPINTPDDMRGLKIRSPDVPAHTSVYQGLEAAPTILTFSEVYSALQTHLVDAVGAPIVNISTSKLYEVTSHLSLTGHIWEGLWLAANPAAWSRLPADVEAIATKHLNQAALVQRQDVADSEGQFLEALKATLEVITPDAAPFREKLSAAGYYRARQELLGPKAWAALEEVAGTLG